MQFKIGKKKKNIALVILFCLLAVIILSSVFITANAEHRCIGETCPICEQISFCVVTLGSLGLVLAGWIAFSFVHRRSETRTLFRYPVFSVNNSSLITLKVKLNM